MKIEILTKKLKLQEVYTLDELIVLGLLISILLPIYFTIAATVLTLGYLIVQHRIKNILTSVKGAYWIFALCCLSLIVSFYSRNFSGLLIAVVMFIIFVIGMYVRIVMTRALFENIIDISIAFSVVCFIIAILQQYCFSSGSSYRADSTFMNANYYATYIEFVILFCIYKFLKNPAWKVKSYLLTVIFINICALYLCDCRTAFIVLGFTVPVMLVLYRKYKALFIMIGISVAGIASLLLFPDLFPRGSNLNSDLNTRLSIWKTSIKGILENPLFGQGGNTYAHIYSKFGGHPAPHAHNILLDQILNFGIIGTGLLCLFLKENIASVHKMYSSKNDQDRFNLFFAVLLCVILHGLFDNTIFGIQTGLFFVLFLGVAGISESYPAFHKLSLHEIQNNELSNRTVNE